MSEQKPTMVNGLFALTLAAAVILGIQWQQTEDKLAEVSDQLQVCTIRQQQTDLMIDKLRNYNVR